MAQTNSIPSPGAHPITLKKAVSLTTTYRAEKEAVLAPAYKGLNILPLSETFNRDCFDTLLAVTGAVAIRLYYGMDENLKVHAVFVAVNAANEDIAANASVVIATTIVMQSGQRCPTLCPPASVLNTDKF